MQKKVSPGSIPTIFTRSPGTINCFETKPQNIAASSGHDPSLHAGRIECTKPIIAGIVTLKEIIRSWKRTTKPVPVGF
jgi:hypothetical protein